MENVRQQEADICLISEGAYPYIFGGVSAWTHDLIGSLKEYTFHVMTLMPESAQLEPRYVMPKNVIGHTVFLVQMLPEGARAARTPPNTWDVVEGVFKGLIDSSHFSSFDPLLSFVQQNRKILGKKILSESMRMWEGYLGLYREMFATGPFRSYFNTAYVLCKSLFSVLLPELPKAKVYHALCTGFAGFCLYRAKKEQGAPCILTEHGIYSNERRIEIAMAEWISDYSALNLALDGNKKTLKHFWLNTFLSLAYCCYAHCDEVLTIFDGNRETQIAAGADLNKMRTIPAGVRISSVPVKKEVSSQPVVAFVGRIVPIKDVKTFIWACHMVRQVLPSVRFYALGPTEEEPEYYLECARLVAMTGLQDYFSFTGKVDMDAYYPKIDLLVLTSLSEALPRTMMEAGFRGIPCVATNVGACHELCYGSPYEDPPLGQGGIITSLGDPQATAHAIVQLLSDPELYARCSRTMANRIVTYYNMEREHKSYKELYAKYCQSRAKVS